MNFLEAITEVKNATGRPDKDILIQRAINQAIAFATIRGDFHQDLVETTFAVDATLYGDTVSIAALTRFRRFKYIKPTGKRGYLHKIDPENVFSPESFMQKNWYYLAGTTITYAMETLVASFEIGYYQYPIRLDTTTNTTHWMLDVMPDAINTLAASKVFADTGNDNEAARAQKEGMLLLGMFIADSKIP